MKINKFAQSIWLSISIFCLAACFLSCTQNGRVTDSQSEWGLVPLEGRIFFTIQQLNISETEDLSVENQKIRLIMWTEKSYPCGFQNEIVSELVFTDKLQKPSFEVSVQGVFNNEVCLEIYIPGPAIKGFIFDTPENKWFLQFSYENLRDVYLVSLSDGRIEVTPLGSTFTYYNLGGPVLEN